MSIFFRVASTLAALAACLLVVTSPSRAFAKCDPAGVDAPSVAAARAAVQANCNCAGVTSHANWSRCAGSALESLVSNASLSRSCQIVVRRIELGSTCGRPGKVVCCRTGTSGRTKASIVAPLRCGTPPGIAASVSASVYLADACVGDPEPATEIALASGTRATDVFAASVPGTFLVSFTDDASLGGPRAFARRITSSGSTIDAAPVAVSDVLPSSIESGGSSASGVTANGSAFYVAWLAYADYVQHIRGRRVAATGAIVSAVDDITSWVPVGFCTYYLGGPLGLAPTLDSSSTHVVNRWSNSCGSTQQFETLGGFPGFSFPASPLGTTSVGPAQLARGISNVAGVAWGRFILSTTPFVAIDSLRAGWIAPGPTSSFELAPTSPGVSPALAALGDTFLALFVTRANPGDAVPTQLRGIRFSRTSGALDPPAGLLMAAASGAIGKVAAASDGTGFVVAWREKRPAGTAIRALHVAADGIVLDAAPVEVATSDDAASLAITADATATLVAFTRAQVAGIAVRGVLLTP